MIYKVFSLAFSSKGESMTSKFSFYLLHILFLVLLLSLYFSIFIFILNFSGIQGNISDEVADQVLGPIMILPLFAIPFLYILLVRKIIIETGDNLKQRVRRAFSIDVLSFSSLALILVSAFVFFYARYQMTTLQLQSARHDVIVNPEKL